LIIRLCQIEQAAIKAKCQDLEEVKDKVVLVPVEEEFFDETQEELKALRRVANAAEH